MRTEGAGPAEGPTPREGPTPPGGPGLLSRRVPRDYAPNAWAARLDALRRSGAPLLDLTETNPTRAGLSAPAPEALLALAPAGLARYDPDPRGLPVAREAVAAYC